MTYSTHSAHIAARYVRLAGFPLGLGLALALVSGTFNRVLIVEYDLPATLVGLFFAAALLIAPVRAWLGYLSDGYPIAGKRREPYIALGAVAGALGIVAAALITVRADAAGPVLISGLGAAFLAWALGMTLASNTFEALLADTFSGAGRPRAVTTYKVAMFAGIMLGALALGRVLDPFDERRFVVVVGAVMALFAGLAVAATFRQERPTEPAVMRAARPSAVPFWRVVRGLIWQDRHARRFFVVVVLAVLGTLAQDVLLEPYGALVLGLSVGETTQLTGLWGGGTILALLGCGIWLIPRWGYMPMLRGGLLLNVAVFPAIIVAGLLESAALFLALVFALGVGTGLSMAGLLTAVIEFTTATRAGLLMGVWGMAAEFGQAIGGLMGGIVVDTVLWLSADNALLAYGTVFAVEGGLLLVALALTANLRTTPAHDDLTPDAAPDSLPERVPIDEMTSAVGL